MAPIFKNTSGSNIRQKVLEVVNERIDNAEREYFDECIRLEEKLKQDKENLLVEKVHAITSKLF